MDDMGAEDIYYVEIPNNKRFKGVYVNKVFINKKEVVDNEYSCTENRNIIEGILKLNIDTEFKIYLLKRELEIFRLKCDLRSLKRDFKQLKLDLLGTENNEIDENKDEDDLFE